MQFVYPGSNGFTSTEDEWYVNATTQEVTRNGHGLGMYAIVLVIYDDDSVVVQNKNNGSWLRWAGGQQFVSPGDKFVPPVDGDAADPNNGNGNTGDNGNVGTTPLPSAGVWINGMYIGPGEVANSLILGGYQGTRAQGPGSVASGNGTQTPGTDARTGGSNTSAEGDDSEARNFSTRSVGAASWTGGCHSYDWRGQCTWGWSGGSKKFDGNESRGAGDSQVRLMVVRGVGVGLVNLRSGPNKIGAAGPETACPIPHNSVDSVRCRVSGLDPLTGECGLWEIDCFIRDWGGRVDILRPGTACLYSSMSAISWSVNPRVEYASDASYVVLDCFSPTLVEWTADNWVVDNVKTR